MPAARAARDRRGGEVEVEVGVGEVEGEEVVQVRGGWGVGCWGWARGRGRGRGPELTSAQGWFSGLCLVDELLVSLPSSTATACQARTSVLLTQASRLGVLPDGDRFFPCS